jgi:hypothetical protein
MSSNAEMQLEGGGNNPKRCAACKYLRRRCDPDCVLAPYFPASHPQRYACVHHVFGASNVARMLQVRTNPPLTNHQLAWFVRAGSILLAWLKVYINW